jgi:hypothetical protein
LRGSNNFDAIEAYQAFIDGIVQQHNLRNAPQIDLERKSLQPLPQHKSVDYTEVVAKVSSSSTIEVRKITYSLPSRLIGETLRIRLYHDRLCCYLGSSAVAILKRLYTKNSSRGRQIDYRHLIHSLVKKPQAFRYSALRNEILPNEAYQQIWLHVDSTMAPRDACKFIVGLLHLAAVEACEERLADEVLRQIKQTQVLSLVALQSRFMTQKPRPTHGQIVVQHELMRYNALLREACYG